MANDNETRPEQDQDSGGATLPAALTAPGPDRAQPKPRGEPTALAGLAPKLAIIVAIVASAIAGALWWQYRQFYVELAGADETLQDRIDDVLASVRRIDDGLNALESIVARGAADLSTQQGEFEALITEQRALDRRIEALQGGRLDARDTWLREQAEYYLVLANTELTLGRRVGNAIQALELADDLLRDIGDPGLLDVRAAIAAERQALRALALPDLDGLAVSLRTLAARVADLPMRALSPDPYSAEAAALAEVEPGFARLWASTRAALGSIIRIEKHDAQIGPLLSEAERRVARRQLELELANARAAVLAGRQEEFRASLVAADLILSRDFDQSAAAIGEARGQLASLVVIDLAPALPDISESLLLLRAAHGGQ
jgi:uncharacterized protein HemX